MEGVHVVGAGSGGLEDGSFPVGSMGKAPIEGLGTSEAKCEISNTSFNVFL